MDVMSMLCTDTKAVWLLSIVNVLGYFYNLGKAESSARVTDTYVSMLNYKCCSLNLVKHNHDASSTEHGSRN